MNGDMDWPETLEGKLVEVFGLKGRLKPTAESRPSPLSLLEDDDDGVEVNGRQGRVIGWSDEDQKYVVELFDGVIVGVAEENLKEFFPPIPEEGGFDVAWPSGTFTQEFFADYAAQHLSQKGYCMIQMFMPPAARKRAAEEVEDTTSPWLLPQAQLEVPYLGHGNTTKYISLEPDDLAKEPKGSLAQCDRTLTNLGLMLGPLTYDYLGFDLWGRHGGMVRAPFTNNSEESRLRPDSLNLEDFGEDGRVYGHVNFLERRKIFAMYFIENEGGELWLHPKEGQGMNEVRLPLSKGRVVIFLADMMTHSYKPKGDHLMLQTFYITEPLNPDLDDEKVVSLPLQQQGDRCHITALEMRFPGGAYGPDMARCVWTAGTDACLQFPIVRFEWQPYYDPENVNAALYTKHGAPFDDRLWMGFDNNFFGITYDEAAVMSPSQRSICEVGYEILFSEGYRKDAIKGLECGFYLGDAGADYVQQQQTNLYMQSQQGQLSPGISTGIMGSLNSSRLSYLLGMRGPCVSVDTACSSSLVALSQVHRSVNPHRDGEQLKPAAESKHKKSVVMGVSLLDGLGTFMVYCSAGMLSRGGRSFTFDESATGFARGEGCGGVFVTHGDSEEDAQRMLGCLIGSNVNQDGRSASLSAPNGPAQQKCIKASMQEAGLTPSDITIAECHGTGTALGDPIEVSALRDVMKDRKSAIVLTTAKSNFGHMEACAGAGGIAKCMMMLTGCMGSPNVHLNLINPHIEFIGFPAIFVDNMVDCGANVGIAGVSSFGVGGTNARGDIWNRKVIGANSTSEVNTFKKLRLRSVLYDRIRRNGSSGLAASDKVYLAGTWNMWKGLTEMQRGVGGVYTCKVALGEARVERFRIVLNGEEEQTIYPAVNGSDQSGEILGPDWECNKKSWLLDGREDAAPVGAVYKISFSWEFSWEAGEQKVVTWERIDQLAISDEAGAESAGADVEPQIDGLAVRHQYAIRGTWTTWAIKPMEAGKFTPEGPWVWRATVRIGLSGQEEFQLLRDGDEEQVFYPATPNASKTSIPVMGPDDGGKGHHWLIRGPTGEQVVVVVSMSKELTTVTLNSPTKGVKSWNSTNDEDWHDYYVVCSCADWEPVLMKPVAKRKGAQKCKIVLGDSGEEFFNIIIDKDWSFTLYPDKEAAAQDEANVMGPDDLGHDLYWKISGSPGAKIEVELQWQREDDMEWWEVRWTDTEARGGMLQDA